MIRLVSCNARGLCQESKQRSLRAKLTDPLGFDSPDIFFLQETRLAAKHLTRGLDLNTFGSFYQVIHAPAVDADPCAGVSIAVRRHNHVTAFVGTECDPGGRWIMATYTHKDIGDITLACVYAPASNPAARAALFASFPWDKLGARAIVAGDWNCIISPEDCERSSTSGTQVDPSERHRETDALVLAKNLRDHALRDVRGKLGNLVKTRFSRDHVLPDSDGITSTLLDRIYVTRAVEALLSDFHLLQLDPSLSDHRAARLVLRSLKVKRGEGLWRMEPGSAKIRGLSADIETLVNLYLEDENPHDGEWYTRLVLDLRAIIQTAEKRVKEKHVAKLRDARERRNNALDSLKVTPRDPACYKEFKIADSALKEIELERGGAIINHRQLRWLRGAERPTAAFFRSVNLVKTGANIITSLRNAQDSSPEALCTAAQEYYQRLFAGPAPSEEDIDYMCSFIHRKLGPAEAANLARPITTGDLEFALKKARNLSAPGPDGLRVELYKLHPCLLKPIVEVWDYCSATKSPLPRTLVGGAISLLHKKGPRDDLDNYRPITLQPVALKAIAGAYTQRLNNVIKLVVGPNQTGFIPGRDIRSNIYDVLLGYEACKRDNISGAMVFIDLKKAYDKLSHRYLFRVLETMGFPPELIDAIKLLLCNGFSQVSINGFLSLDILLGSGLQQGSPSSPPLYSIATEPFRAAVELTPEPGLKVAGVELRVDLFADDTSGMAGCQPGFNRFMRILVRWCSASTSEVNWSKSSALTFGPSPPNVGELKVLERNQFERVLGARIGRGRDRQPVWSVVTERIQAKLARYAPFGHLTIFARATLANACILSHAWYAASFTKYAEMDLIKLWKQCCGFLWCKTPGFKKIRYEQCRAPRAHGGLGLVDPRLEARAIHAFRLVSALMAEEDGQWRHLLWDALLDVAPLHWKQLLTRRWREEDFRQHSLAADILVAWGMLDVTGAPELSGQLRRSFVAGQGFLVVERPPIPPKETLAAVRAAGKSLAELDIKAIYRHLRKQDLRERADIIGPPKQLDIPGADSVKHWNARWNWIAATILPPKAKQLFWLRWHKIVYLGENHESPVAMCPHCPDDTPDGPMHFAKECPVARRATRYFMECWERWLPQTPAGQLRLWHRLELAPEIKKKKKAADGQGRRQDDGDSIQDPQRVFLATWAILVHALYRTRAAASYGRSAVVGRGDFDDDEAPPSYFPALEAIQLWKADLRALLLAFAKVDMTNESERKGMPKWRAQFALDSWYQEICPGNPNAKVRITFADEGDYISIQPGAEAGSDSSSFL